MELGLIRKIDIDHEMQQSYLDYAMSVIVARALPDARDGLKPVQRRILYAMYDMGLRPDSAYKKSARIVGEVLGKYHPHGDMAVYDAMARMAQDFSMRYMLVNGQGNFGSVDGDPPAAMRYTEARLTAAAMEIINQIEKNTVDFTANFDDTLSEPDVLPAAIPNLLVNGATGIAVGMATNIPPHNLGEVVDALVYMLEQWDKQDDIAVDQLMRFIQGPDFPTGGVIIQDPEGDGLTSAYGTGRGRFIVQARAHLEEMVRGRNRIIVTELPYMTNKSSLIERIAEMAREGTLEGLADLRDESDRQGMRIVIELSKTADPEAILRELYKRTPMQITFGIILLALVDGEPRLLSLKQALRVYLEHRLTVIRRRSEYDLERAKQRAHVLEGLRIALQHLDEVIALIRNSQDVDQARQRLMKRYKLSEIQANAILEMPLRRLAALERKKIELEYRELLAQIKDLEALLRSPKKIRGVASEELLAIKEAYGDRRRTQIVRLKEGVSAAALLTTTDVTPEQTCWIGVSEDGRISRSSTEESPRLAGRDAPRWLVRATTHHVLYLVSTQGKAAAIPVHSVPEAAKLEDGVAYASITPLENADELAAIFALPASRGDPDDERYVLTASRAGMVKKSVVTELPGPSAQAFTLVRINDGDELGWVLVTNGKSELLLATAQGMAIRFSEAEVRPMGLVAAGVSGIKLAARDLVVTAEILPPQGEVFLLASDGKAKRVELKDFPIQGRYGQGVIAWKLPRGVSLAGAMTGEAVVEGVVSFAKAVPRLVRLGDAAQRGRAAQGKELLEIRPGDEILSLYTVWDALAAWSGERRQMGRRKPSTPKKAGTQARSADGKGAIQPGSRTKATKSQTGAAKTRAERKPASGRSKAQTAGKPSGRATTASKAQPADKAPAAKPGRAKAPQGKKPSAKKTPAGGKPAGRKTSQKPKSSARKPKTG